MILARYSILVSLLCANAHMTESARAGQDVVVTLVNGEQIQGNLVADAAANVQLELRGQVTQIRRNVPRQEISSVRKIVQKNRSHTVSDNLLQKHNARSIAELAHHFLFGSPTPITGN